jgi:hypothetical protein
MFSIVTAHPKTSYVPSGIHNASAARSIRRPTAQTSAASSKIATSSSLVPTPTVDKQPPQLSLQIPPPTNNKTERRLSRLHVVQPSSSSINPPVPSTHEPPLSIGLHGPFGQMILDYRSTLTYTPITNSNLHQNQNHQKDLRICVAIRKRLLNKHEIAKKDNDVIIIPNRDHCLVHVPKSKVDQSKKEIFVVFANGFARTCCSW